MNSPTGKPADMVLIQPVSSAADSTPRQWRPGGQLAIGGATHVVRREAGHILLDAPRAVAAALNRTIRHCLRTADLGEA